MERQLNQTSFLDSLTAELGGTRSAEFFDKCDRLIPWKQLVEPLQDMYTNRSAQGGAPNYPLVLMVKCLMLQKWFNLSDPMLEEMLRDRLSFRRFVGLPLAESTPDETTFVRFRKRLANHGHIATLFETTLKILRERNVILEQGTCVDATIIEAPRGRTSPNGTGSTKDQAASYTQKHGRTYHGYKGHIATDPNGMIKDYRFDTAARHDSNHFDEFVTEETSSVWADSAYMDKTRKAELESRGVFCGIIERRVRGQAELSEVQKRHNRLVAGVRAVVEHPFAWMKNTGYRRTRYRGIMRNALDFGLHVIAYNWKRSFSLQIGVT